MPLKMLLGSFLSPPPSTLDTWPGPQEQPPCFLLPAPHGQPAETTSSLLPPPELPRIWGLLPLSPGYPLTQTLPETLPTSHPHQRGPTGPQGK